MPDFTPSIHILAQQSVIQ